MSEELTPGYLCKGCNNRQCPIDRDLSDSQDKPQDCPWFVWKSMCWFCRYQKKCNSFEGKIMKICGNFRHEKMYSVSI
jgi:hypothetical protein